MHADADRGYGTLDLWSDPTGVGSACDPSPQAPLFDPALALGRASDAIANCDFAAHDLVLESERIHAALRTDAAASKVMAKRHELHTGQLVGVRLNLNFLKATGFAVHTIHAATNKTGYRTGRGFWNGAVLTYEECVTLSHAFFNVSQKAREQIAEGCTAKFPMASIDGTLASVVPIPRCYGVEVAFNPKREHLFRLPDGQSIWYAERVVVFQHRAYASGRIVLHTERSAPERAGSAPTQALVHTH